MGKNKARTPKCIYCQLIYALHVRRAAVSGCMDTTYRAPDIIYLVLRSIYHMWFQQVVTKV